MQLGASAHDEKILVLVRLRPLNDKEISRNEVSDWECINDGTILYRNSLQERSALPSAYSFDGVFRSDCSTMDVYEGGGVRDIALSVVGGINSTIFAYGQTSSGKTHTMSGITEYTVADIYDYVYRHEERAFVLKFSAIEIYNENVRDLLSTDVAPLRLLDDPEKGTTVERLTEETLRDWNHLKELLSICEAQRQIGETYLNETSSRSHQILRLTVESSSREFIGKDSSTTLAASVNFVDLAGSERASQSLSVGTRLKEGCHINRSLLTLGTVIRKLSKGRNGHINYRDSKLTRILQPSLGGNSRTAIICTLSPARSHVEQSRNTLLFASCAKEVSTKAQVNVVMSDKALVKHLQRELARLETELRSPVPSSSCDYAVLLRKKDNQIEKMEKEIGELIKQRDLAQSRVADLLHMLQCDDSSRQSVAEVCGDLIRPRVKDDVSADVPSNSIPELASGGENELYKDVQCIETKSIAGATGRSPEKLAGEDEEAAALTATATPSTCDGLFTPLHRQMTVPSPAYEKSPSVGLSSCRTISLARSRSCGTNLTNGTFSPTSEKSQYNLKTPCEIESALPRGCRVPPLIYNTDIVFRHSGKRTSREGSNSAEENITSVDDFVAELTQMAEIQYGTPGNNTDSSEASPNWSMEFEKRRNAIIELWQACNISLVHRTYFFLLFRGDRADSIYMEVELRKLSFLKEAFSREDDVTLASSGRTLRREREMLCKLMVKRFSDGEREEMYGRWGIGLETKRRRLQLVNMLWCDTNDLNRVEESAAIVAKLVRFSEQGRSLKEMSGLTFTPAYEHKKFYRFGSIFSMSPAY